MMPFQPMTRALSAISATLLTTAAASQAAVSYAYVAQVSPFDAANGSATITVLLQERLTAGSTSVINADGGLSGAGFRLSLTSNPGPAFASFAPATDFSGLSFTNTTLPADAAEFNVNTSSGGVLMPDSGLLPLATVTVSGLGPTGATFTLARNANFEGSNTLTANSLYNLDDDSLNPTFDGVGESGTSYTLAVPEPVGGLAAVAAGGVLLRRHRRLR